MFFSFSFFRERTSNGKKATLATVFLLFLCSRLYFDLQMSLFVILSFKYSLSLAATTNR